MLLSSLLCRIHDQAEMDAGVRRVHCCRENDHVHQCTQQGPAQCDVTLDAAGHRLQVMMDDNMDVDDDHEINDANVKPRHRTRNVQQAIVKSHHQKIEECCSLKINYPRLIIVIFSFIFINKDNLNL